MGCRERGTYRDSSRESSLSRTGTDDLDKWESIYQNLRFVWRRTAKIRTFILERILEGRARLISIEGWFYRDMIDIEGRVGVPK